MILTARVLRLMRLLTALKPFQLIGKISAEILPAAKSVIISLFLVLYFFAALGMGLYGGLITRDPSNPTSYLLLNTDFSESDYWANNFNDMISGMNVSNWVYNHRHRKTNSNIWTIVTAKAYTCCVRQVLFNLLVVNNWFVCEVGFEAATQGKWVRLYFLSFHVFGVILVNNLVIAFIINSFMAQLAIFRERTYDEVVDDGEAVLRGRRAIFDASQVTGTKTSLRGDYIARLRHSYSDNGDDDKNHQERLRKLFTRSSSSNVGLRSSSRSAVSMPES